MKIIFNIVLIKKTKETQVRYLLHKLEIDTKVDKK